MSIKVNSDSSTSLQALAKALADARANSVASRQASNSNTVADSRRGPQPIEPTYESSRTSSPLNVSYAYGNVVKTDLSSISNYTYSSDASDPTISD
jgi:hypothetical protein